MVGYRTSKRLTYFLIIRQLRFDKHDDIANELEHTVFKGIGSSTLHTLAPSDDLQKIIGANSVCTNHLSCAANDLASLMDDPKCSRTPHPSSDRDDELQLLSQTVNQSLPTFYHTQTKCDDSLSENSTLKDIAKQTRRGRSLNSVPSQGSQNDPQPGDFVSELQKISQELINNENGTPVTPIPNSFSSIAVPSSGRPNSNASSDVTPLTPPDQTTFSDVTLDSEPRTLSTVPTEPAKSPAFKVDELVTNQNPIKSPSPPSISPVPRSPDPIEETGNYTHYAITKITSDDSAKQTSTISNDVANVASRNVYLNSPSGKPSKTKFSDYGNPEDFANTTKSSSKAVKSASAVRQNTSSSGATSKPSASGTVTVDHNASRLDNSTTASATPGPATPAFRLSDNADLCTYDFEHKLKVLSILAEGWKLQATFEKRVKKEIPRVGKPSMEEILYAVFSFAACDFVEFQEDSKNRKSVRLNPRYRPEHFETILEMVS